jgi:hypothetical protein
MNRFRHLLLLALMGLITACSYNELPEDLVPQTIYEEDGLVLSVETRAETCFHIKMIHDFSLN